MKKYDAMKEWGHYLDLFNSGAGRKELLCAAKAMQDKDNQKTALLNLGVTTAADRREINARWKSINAVSDKEAAEHCQFEGFFKNT